MELDPIQLQRLINDAVDQAILRYRMENGEEKRYISENKAVQLYGSIVYRWIEEELIDFQQDGPKAMKRLDRYKLETLAKQANRNTYLPVKDRKYHKSTY